MYQSRRLYNQLVRCTVRLTVPGGRDQGTGFFVAPGRVLTCAHVVEAAWPDKAVDVHWAGGTIRGQIVPEHFRPENVDLALLRVELANHPCVRLHEAYTLGDEMLAFGYPLGSTTGDPVTLVSEDWQRDRWTSPDQPHLKLKEGQIQPGLSGAPLLNRRTGGVCGVVRLTRDRASDLGGRALPTALVLAQYDFLNREGKARPPRRRRLLGGAVGAALAMLLAVLMMTFVWKKPLSYKSEVLADHPAAYWQLNEVGGATALDSSPNGYHGKYIGGVTLGQTSAFPTLGTSVAFDGRTGHINIGFHRNLNLTMNFTLEAWIKPRGGPGKIIISNRLDNGSGTNPGGFGFGIGKKTRSLLFTTCGIFDGDYISEIIISLNEWSHVAVTVDHTGNVKFYLNGKLLGTMDVTAPGLPSREPINIGRSPVADIAGRFNYWDGLIDDVAIYNSALPASRIQAHYNAAKR